MCGLKQFRRVDNKYDLSIFEYWKGVHPNDEVSMLKPGVITVREGGNKEVAATSCVFF